MVAVFQTFTGKGTVDSHTVHVFAKSIITIIYLPSFLSQIGSARNMGKISQWADHIINHFWFCCEMASKETSSDEEALRKMKVIILHITCSHSFHKPSSG